MIESKQNLRRIVHRKLLGGGPVCIANLPPFVTVGASQVEYVLEERRQPGGLISIYKHAARKNVLFHDILRHEPGRAVTVVKLRKTSERKVRFL